MTYANLREVLDANDAAGQHFFDTDTMEFFNSKLESDIIDGRFFITSERFDFNTPKQYTIRAAQDDGAIVTLGDFGQYETLDDARDVLAGGMIDERLKYLRGEIEAERISYGEIEELQTLAEQGLIPDGDVVLLEWAGVSENDEGARSSASRNA